MALMKMGPKMIVEMDRNGKEKSRQKILGVEHCTAEKEIAEQIKVLMVKDVKVIQAERIQVDGSRRRPMQVKIRWHRLNYKALNKLKELRHIKGYQKVFISPDMTFSEREREKEKKLRVEHKARKIRKEKVIKNCVITQCQEEARAQDYFQFLEPMCANM